MMPATLSIITNAFPPQERGKAIGTWAGVSAMALAIGPVVGGFLVENVSWQSIFFLNVPVAAVAVVGDARPRRASRATRPRATRSTSPASSRSPSALGALVLALVEGNSWGWGSPAIIALFARRRSSAAIGFAYAESHSAEPMVDFTFFRSSSFLGANIVAFIVSFAMLAMFFFLALYMQNIMGYSPLEAGVRFLPSTAVIIVAGPIAGRLTDRIGPKPLMTLGLLIVSGVAVLAGPPDDRHELRLPRRRVRPDGPRHGPRDVADEHGRDERGRARQGRRRVRDPVDEPHGRRHVRRRRDGRARDRRSASAASTASLPNLPESARSKLADSLGAGGAQVSGQVGTAVSGRLRLRAEQRPAHRRRRSPRSAPWSPGC